MTPTVHANALWCFCPCLVWCVGDVSSMPTLREGEEFTDANGNAPSATASTRAQVGGQKHQCLSGPCCLCLLAAGVCCGVNGMVCQVSCGVLVMSAACLRCGRGRSSQTQRQRGDSLNAHTGRRAISRNVFWSVVCVAPAVGCRVNFDVPGWPGGLDNVSSLRCGNRRSVQTCAAAAAAACRLSSWSPHLFCRQQLAMRKT
jgi:hypothetical protein